MLEPDGFYVKKETNIWDATLLYPDTAAYPENNYTRDKLVIIIIKYVKNAEQ